MCTPVRSSFLLLPALCIALLAPAAAIAQEHEGSGQAEQPGTGEGHHEGHFRNGLYGFLGTTHDVIEGEDRDEVFDGFTFGIEYERILSDRFAVGALVERAAGEVDSTLAFALLYVQPIESIELVLLAGPGIEWRREPAGHGEATMPHDEHGEPGEHGEGEPPMETSFVYRVGLGYAIEVEERWVIFPTAAIDLLRREHAWVFGVDVGFHF